MEIITVPIRGGEMVASVAPDADYPGRDIEFIPENDDCETGSRPRVLFEYQKDKELLRVLVWADSDNEDYTHQIVFK